MKDERTWTIDGVSTIFHLSITATLQGFNTYLLYSHSDRDKFEPLLEIFNRISNFPVLTIIDSVAMMCYFDVGYGTDLNIFYFLLGSIGYVIYSAVHAFLFGLLCLALWKGAVWLANRVNKNARKE